MHAIATPVALAQAALVIRAGRKAKQPTTMTESRNHESDKSSSARSGKSQVTRTIERVRNMYSTSVEKLSRTLSRESK